MGRRLNGRWRLDGVIPPSVVLELRHGILKVAKSQAYAASVFLITVTVAHPARTSRSRSRAHDALAVGQECMSQIQSTTPLHLTRRGLRLIPVRALVDVRVLSRRLQLVAHHGDEPLELRVRVDVLKVPQLPRRAGRRLILAALALVVLPSALPCPFNPPQSSSSPGRRCQSRRRGCRWQPFARSCGSPTRPARSGA